MHVAIVSDIHGNRHAFEAVLADAEAAGADEVWCLGDLVGYGAEPAACIELALARCAVVLAGNHDLGVTGAIALEDFSAAAAAAAAWTRGVLTPDQVEALAALRPADTSRAVGLFHASPRDPVWEYVLSELLAELCLDEQRHRVCLVGHSHVALAFGRRPGAPVVGALAPAGTEADLAEGEWLLNPGSVGQPRDGDPRAAWLLLDVAAHSAVWRRVAYDVAAAGAAIRAAGLPGSLAERLEYGQ
jgi:predicted phosphodiesterase